MPAITPTQILPGYDLLAAGEAAPSQGVFIPLATLANLTAAEGDAAAGDGRKVVFEICRAAFATFSAMDAANRPTRFTITRATPTGVDASRVRQGYTLTFDLDVSNADVAPEA